MRDVDWDKIRNKGDTTLRVIPWALGGLTALSFTMAVVAANPAEDGTQNMSKRASYASIDADKTTPNVIDLKFGD